MFCEQCGASLPENAGFCGSCGTKTGGQAAVEALQAPHTMQAASVPRNEQAAAVTPPTMAQTAQAIPAAPRHAFNAGNLLVRIGGALVLAALAWLLYFWATSPHLMRIVTEGTGLEISGAYAISDLLTYFYSGYGSYQPTMVSIAAAVAVVLLLVAAIAFLLLAAGAELLGRAGKGLRFVALFFGIASAASLATLGFASLAFYPSLKAIIAKSSNLWVGRILGVDAPLTFALAAGFLVLLVGLFIVGVLKKRRAQA